MTQKGLQQAGGKCPVRSQKPHLIGWNDHVKMAQHLISHGVDLEYTNDFCYCRPRITTALQVQLFIHWRGVVKIKTVPACVGEASLRTAPRSLDD